MPELIYDVLVFIAGFIDSVAGGGGLITVPILTMVVGPGAIAIGTNKIVGLTAALTALIVYARKGNLKIKKSWPFLLGILIGTWLGAKLAMHLPVELFKYFLFAACPIILFITLKRDSFLTRDLSEAGFQSDEAKSQSIETNFKSNEIKAANEILNNKMILYFIKIAFLGFACGFYDGVFGPGGGTFMFLSLAGFGGFSILAALATSKLANTFSAATALTSFALDQSVIWPTGLKYALYAGIGAFLGSRLASEKAKQVVRPALVIVVLMLLGRMVMIL